MTKNEYLFNMLSPVWQRQIIESINKTQAINKCSPFTEESWKCFRYKHMLLEKDILFSDILSYVYTKALKFANSLKGTIREFALELVGNIFFDHPLGCYILPAKRKQLVKDKIFSFFKSS